MCAYKQVAKVLPLEWRACERRIFCFVCWCGCPSSRPCQAYCSINSCEWMSGSLNSMLSLDTSWRWRCRTSTFTSWGMLSPPSFPGWSRFRSSPGPSKPYQFPPQCPQTLNCNWDFPELVLIQERPLQWSGVLNKKKNAFTLFHCMDISIPRHYNAFILQAKEFLSISWSFSSMVFVSKEFEEQRGNR